MTFKNSIDWVERNQSLHNYHEHEEHFILEIVKSSLIFL